MDPLFADLRKTGKYIEHPSHPNLFYRFLTQGPGGEKPKAHNRVTVHYEGQLTNGNIFDSSYRRNQTITFGLNQVIQGWTIACQLMSVGDKIEVVIPYELAYGERGMPGAIPPRATLVFTIELFKID